MQDVFIGADVAQDKLDIAGSPGCEHLSLANQGRAIGAWLRKLPAGSAIAMESPGSYHWPLAVMARDAGMRVFVLNRRRPSSIAGELSSGLAAGLREALVGHKMLCRTAQASP